MGSLTEMAVFRTNSHGNTWKESGIAMRIYEVEPEVSGLKWLLLRNVVISKWKRTMGDK